MAGRIFLSKPRDRSASSDGLEPVIVVLTDGSIRLFSHDDQPLSAHTVLSEFPNMNLASLDGPVSPSAPLLPGETYFLTPRRASAREQASSIRFTTPSPASAFRAPATLPLRSPRAVSDGNIPLMRGGAGGGGWALRRDLEASVENVSFNHVATFPTTATATTTTTATMAATAAATIESIQTAGVWSRASSSSAAESPSCASGSTQSREETFETCFAAQESFGSGRGSSFDSGRAGDDDEEPDWSRYEHDGPSISLSGRHGGYYTDDSKAHVLQKSRTHSGAQRCSNDSRLHADEVPSRFHVALSPRATPNPILAELAVLEEELSPEEEEPAEADACSSSATGGGATSRAPHAPSSAAVAEAASLKGKVLAVLSRFNPRHLRRAASASSSKDAMTAAPPPGSVEFARRDADLPPVSAVAARHAFSRAGAMCGDDAESAQGWVDVEGPVLMMTDTRIRHRVPPGSRSCTAMGQQGAFAQQEQNGVSGITSASPISMEQGAWESARHPTWAGPVIVSQQTSFSTEPAGGVNSFASQQLQRAPSLEAAQRAEHSYEHCEEWHSYSSGLAPGRRAWVRLSEDSVRGRSSSAAARNEYIMPPASERYLSGPPLLQAHM